MRCCSANSARTIFEPLRAALHVVMTVNALMGLFEFADAYADLPLSPRWRRASRGHALDRAAGPSAHQCGADRRLRRFADGGRQDPARLAARRPDPACSSPRSSCSAAAPRSSSRWRWRRCSSSTPRSPRCGAAVSRCSPRRSRRRACRCWRSRSCAALASGLADPLLMRFVDDNGSAATRVIMFDMLGPFSWRELLVGPDIEQVESLRRHFGLEQGVENPFIRMTLYQGGLVMAAVFASLVWFFRELLRGRGLRVLGPIVAMAVLLNASESISVKTNFLDKLVLMFVCMFPPLAAAAQRALSPSASSMAGSRLRVGVVHQAHAVEQAPERPRETRTPPRSRARRARSAHGPRRARRNSARPCAARRTRRATPGRREPVAFRPGGGGAEIAVDERAAGLGVEIDFDDLLRLAEQSPRAPPATASHRRRRARGRAHRLVVGARGRRARARRSACDRAARPSRARPDA